jgi:hypothetical protein
MRRRMRGGGQGVRLDMVNVSINRVDPRSTSSQATRSRLTERGHGAGRRIPAAERLNHHDH